MASTPTPPDRPDSNDTPLPFVFNTASRWPEVEAIDPLAELPIAPKVSWYSTTKSLFDWCAAALILVPALPIIGLCWLGVKLTSQGPGFYVQKRLARGGREYRMIKLRTMTQDAEANNGGAKWSTKGDSRITGFGKFLRTTHFDELPQLFNVLMGHMSLVGPRPERKEIIEKLRLVEQVPGYNHRQLVKPGVTGIAQIQIPADTDINSVKHKIVYDLYYIENVGLWLDLRIMVATVFKAAGLRPNWLRRLFFLPHRDKVAEVLLCDRAPAIEPAPNLQPV